MFSFLCYCILRTFVDACTTFHTGVLIDDCDILHLNGVLGANVNTCTARCTLFFVNFNHLNTLRWYHEFVYLYFMYERTK